MKLIDKDKIVAEIEKRKSELQSRIAELSTFESNTLGLFQEVDLYDDIISFIDTIETKEVDLEKDKPVTNNLERAALLHYPKMSRISEPHGFIPADNESHYLGDANEDNRKAFIVGAQWQKQQNTLETKEVDLEKEIDKIWNPRFNLGWDEKSLLSINHEGFTTIAKHFYELGLNKGKEE